MYRFKKKIKNLSILKYIKKSNHVFYYSLDVL